jgi:hypothetical protein
MSVVNLKDHQFKKGFDPKRNLNGAPRGTNPLVVLKNRALKNHSNDIDDIIALVISQALSGNEKSQALIFDKFVINANTDLTAENCGKDNVQAIFDLMPIHILENFKSAFANASNEYQAQSQNIEQEIDDE